MTKYLGFILAHFLVQKSLKHFEPSLCYHILGSPQIMAVFIIVCVLFISQVVLWTNQKS